MKTTFKNFLTETTSDDKIMEYFYHDAILECDLGVKFETYKKRNPNVKTPAINFIDSLSNETSLDKQDFLERFPHLEMMTSHSGVVNTESLKIFNYDTLGAPPCILGKIKVCKIMKNAESLKTIPSWFPRKCKVLELGEVMGMGKVGIESLSGIDKVVKECETITLSYLPLKSSVLGLLNIKNLQTVYIYDDAASTISSADDKNNWTDLEKIINHHLLPENRDILDFQNALIDAGFEEYAKL